MYYFRQTKEEAGEAEDFRAGLGQVGVAEKEEGGEGLGLKALEGQLEEAGGLEEEGSEAGELQSSLQTKQLWLSVSKDNNG